MLLHHFLEASARQLPDKTALVCDGQRYSYAQIDRMAAELAAFLQRRGVQRGERVAIFLDNSVETVVGLYAVLKAGAVFMPVNPLTKQDKLAYLLNDSRTSVLLTHAALHDAFSGALAHNRTVHTCVVAGELRTAYADERMLAYATITGAAGALVDTGSIDQDLAAIIYTSGSTGDPKGVMLTHLNMVTATNSVSSYLGLRSDDVILCVLPLAFDYGLYQVLMGFKHGATVVLERSFAFPVKVLEVMTRERVTVLPGVPTIFSLLMNIKTLARHDLGALRMITNTEIGRASCRERV